MTFVPSHAPCHPWNSLNIFKSEELWRVISWLLGENGANVLETFETFFFTPHSGGALKHTEVALIKNKKYKKNWSGYFTLFPELHIQSKSDYYWICNRDLVFATFHVALFMYSKIMKTMIIITKTVQNSEKILL